MPDQQVAIAFHSAGSPDANCPSLAPLSETHRHIELGAPNNPLRTRSRIGVLVRTGADPADIAEARVVHENALLEKRISDLIASSPPLTDGTRRRLVALLAVED